jgi:hypothetical protein
MVEVFWDVGGFIAQVRLQDDPPGHERTLMLSRDSDVVHLIEGPLQAQVKSLKFLRVTRDNGSAGLMVEDVCEILRGTDSRSAGGRELIVFRGVTTGDFCVDDAVADAKFVAAPRRIVRIAG